MPSALELDFLKYTLETQEKKHQRLNFQVGGLYVIGTPESEFSALQTKKRVVTRSAKALIY